MKTLKSRLERETYLSRTENHMFALKSTKTNTKKSLGSAHKKRSVGLVETNNFFLTTSYFKEILSV